MGRLYDGPRPAGPHPFQELRGERHTAVATPGDLLFHLRAEHMDLCFELAQHIAHRLEGHADVVDEVHGFRYFDKRDLLGFVDGTELRIVRENMPFGTVGAGEFGTSFIGYAAHPDVTERMLRNMFLGDPPGAHDRILDFSTAVTGGLFHVPTEDFMEDPPHVRPTENTGSAGATGG
ncbi:Dyp-type peroxidase [Nocardiopsis exhalans]|uniref:Dyp-type peroxidase n=1 Tax=Nocardiopsis exhalans TaxID=163604 RepID=A0ABY5D2K9_9ACTN|nr:Dyp-type peroxidase domain-containing protein [Nocardiopsis exhalans]USY17323.1 Dyp-type peroxidase [Nocardiopsis exhalans]